MDQDRRRCLRGMSAAIAGTVVTWPASKARAAKASLLILEHRASSVALGLDDLTLMPSTQFVTNTIWTRGPQTFRGVQLCDLVAWAGAQNMRNIDAHAANEFVSRIPMSDAVPGGPLIAYLRNGKPMHRRDMGPLWLVYPYDSNSRYRDAETYARSVWQLVRLRLH
ncbi:molybdopterin-dependent oxidoreductase [Profundibacterium mesophilum]|uniref:Sulfite oxidase n=1 Tax=Profundibacterium mesophilum KAUST100406-0324 TaxID=1037889 RepID=A0A921TF62_9RHOB|nr:molybdopterin-dependent oxidoreductase [Profundibacterium mesophilum]KAF0676154.1 putative sulfite oxidase [Profundibacterium mesophilum KAUST100406-0324]